VAARAAEGLMADWGPYPTEDRRSPWFSEPGWRDGVADLSRLKGAMQHLLAPARRATLGEIDAEVERILREAKG
jgi:ribosome modulation factor